MPKLRGILPRYVDIEVVMGMLDHGDAQAPAQEIRDDARQQGGLAGAAPSRKADHFHCFLRTKPSGTKPTDVIARSNATKQSSSCSIYGLLRFARNDDRCIPLHLGKHYIG